MKKTEPARRRYHKSLLTYEPWETRFMYDPASPDTSLVFIDDAFKYKVAQRNKFKDIKVGRIQGFFKKLLRRATIGDVARHLQECGVALTEAQISSFAQGKSKSLFQSAEELQKVLVACGSTVTELVSKRERAAPNTALKHAGCRIYEVRVETSSEVTTALVYGRDEVEAGEALQKKVEGSTVISVTPCAIVPGRVIRKTIVTTQLEDKSSQQETVED